MSNITQLFADGIMDAAVHHGVVRLTLAQQGADGKPQPCGQLVVPLTQLPHVVNGLTGLLKQIEGKLREAQAAAGQLPTAEPDPGAVPGAFRFG